jgi:uroporphyrinogen decarboxylase
MTRTSLQIVLDAIESRASERVPVIPIVGLYSTNVSNIPIIDLLNDGVKQANSQLAARSKYGYDGVFTAMDLTVEAEALGAQVTFPKGAFPYVHTHPLNEADRFEDIQELPVSGSRLSVFIKATQIMSDALADKFLLSSHVIGPFTLAGHLLGIEKLMEITSEEPELAEAIVKHCAKVIEPYIEKLIDAGADNIVILEPSASSSLISPRFFERFSFSNVKSLISRVQSAGVIATLHICGNTSPILKMMSDTNAEVLSIDSEVSLLEARTVIDGKATLMGNVDTALMIGSAAKDVTKASRLCLEEGGSGGKFILSTSCDVPIETPSSNLVEFVASVFVGH